MRLATFGCYLAIGLGETSQIICAFTLWITSINELLSLLQARYNGGMKIELTAEEVEVLITSLKYSLRQVADAEGTPYEVRQENLARIESVKQKLSAARNDEAEES